MARYPLYSKLGGEQGRCGTFRPHRDSIPGRPVRSEPLYRLSYPGPPGRCLATYSLSYRLQERVPTAIFSARQAGICEYKEQRYSMFPPAMNVLQQIHTKIKPSKFFRCRIVICNESNVYSDDNFHSYSYPAFNVFTLTKQLTRQQCKRMYSCTHVDSQAHTGTRSQFQTPIQFAERSAAPSCS